MTTATTRLRRLRPRVAGGARRVEGLHRRARRPLRARRRALEAAPRRRSRSRSAPGRSGTSRTRRPSTSRRSTRRPTRPCSRRPPRRSPTATRRAEVVLGGMFGTPLKGKPPAITAWTFLRDLYGIDGARDSLRRRRGAPVRRARRQDRVPGQPDARRDRRRRRRREHVDHRGRRLVGDGRQPARPRPRGPGRPAQRGVRLLPRQAPGLGHQGGHLVLVAGHPTDESQCDWCAGSGLFPADSLDPKPAWDAFVSFTGGS